MTTPAPWTEEKPTAVLVLANGAVIWGKGVGATGVAEAEVCFNTAMTGYQEILTDPSYADQIVTFTFPHIGNVGANPEDDETSNPEAEAQARGCVLHTDITSPSNWRAHQHFNDWLKERGIIGICGVDTRALTTFIREHGMPNAVIAHDPEGDFDIPALKERAQRWPGIVGADLAARVSTKRPYEWMEGTWRWPEGFARAREENLRLHVVAIDYGIKKNILRCLVDVGCKVTVVPADTPAEDILALKPDGVFLSNGPGDPAATAANYAGAQIGALLKARLPMFGICLGHQMLAIALGGRTKKMKQGHHGANHPVKDFTTAKVEITSMNHGFTVDVASLPEDVVEETHISLFDRTNCGIAMKERPVFSVQHHPEASPGPQDSHYLFRRFADLMSRANTAE
jgi:carbamoyl-phosphate synthase small subunit